jgi:spermidine synthase
MPTVTAGRGFGYGLALFLTSAGGLVLEIVAGRLLAPVVGMSLAAVLAGFSAGNWIGGRLAGPEVGARAGARRLAWTLSLAAVATVAILPLLRPIALGLTGEGMPFLTGLVLTAFALFLPPSLCVGVVSPILTKLALDAAPGRSGAVLGRMYALGAIGSIIGTLAAGFLFISWIGSVGTVLSIAVLYAAIAVGFAVHGRIWQAPAAAALLAAGLTAWGAGSGSFRAPCDMESDYSCIRIADAADRFSRPAAVMVLDHLEHSVNDRDDPIMLFNEYAHLIDELVRERRPELRQPSVFFVGGGGYTLPRLWAEDYPGARLVVAEIDPAVTRMARERMWLADRREIRAVHQDARLALQSLPRTPTFDLVIGDAFNDFAVPPHLITREFAEEIAVRLKSGGLYLLNVVDGGEHPLLLYAVVRTLNRVFPVVEVWMDHGRVSSQDRATFVVLSGATASETDDLVAQRGLRRRWARWPEARLKSGVLSSRVPMLDDDFAPVDRLLAQVFLGRVSRD